MRPRNPDRCKAVAIDGYRLIQEIEISMVSRPEITIRTCGKQVSVSAIIGKDTTTNITLRKIDRAICLLNYNTPCIEKIIEDTDQFLKLGVADSKVVTVTLDTEEQRNQLMSTSFLLPQFRGNTCESCSYVAKLFETDYLDEKLQLTLFHTRSAICVSLKTKVFKKKFLTKDSS